MESIEVYFEQLIKEVEQYRLVACITIGSSRDKKLAICDETDLPVFTRDRVRCIYRLFVNGVSNKSFDNAIDAIEAISYLDNEIAIEYDL